MADTAINVAGKALSWLSGGSGNGGGGSGGSGENSHGHCNSQLTSGMEHLRQEISITEKVHETNMALTNLASNFSNTTEKFTADFTNVKADVTKRVLQSIRSKYVGSLEKYDDILQREMTKNTQEMQLNLQNGFDTVTRTCKSLIDSETKNIAQNIINVKNAFTETLATKTQELNEQICSVQKGIFDGIDKLREDSEAQIEELGKRFFDRLNEEFQKHRDSDEMNKTEIKRLENLHNEMEKKFERFLKETNEKLEKQNKENHEIKEMFKDAVTVAEKQNNEIKLLNKKLSEKDRQNEAIEEKLRKNVEEMKEMCHEIANTEAKQIREELQFLKKQNDNGLEKVEEKVNVAGKEFAKTAKKLREFLNQDLPEFKQRIYQIENKIREESHLKELTQNCFKNEIFEFQKKFDTLNEKYVTLLEENTKQNNKLHELSLQQLKAPNNLPQNHFYHSYYDNEEDDHTVIDGTDNGKKEELITM
uniref:Uncharacterized protein n=1 Tax=Panagrolaimus superbus TaxID=310955 RepID=A0A914Z0M2_9BILA